MNLELVYDFIKNSYWGHLRTFEEQNTAMKNSINFGLFLENTQIAYTRVMTDMVFFAYLLDVFVLEPYRGNSFGKLLIEKILNYPSLNNIDKWMLATRDAHEWYHQFGFTQIKDPSKLMNKMSSRAKKIYE
ncbi:MAG: GNAT family N-acetyltransferase [Flavobacteriaceae bacterium]|nr:GNAT family N-acetyltransferase [Flavobacteriaceae bacterium]